VTGIGRSERAKDLEDRVRVLFTWLYAFATFRRENIRSVVSKLLNELSALLWVGEGEQHPLATFTLHERFDERLLM
jgi:hypothetical protein